MESNLQLAGNVTIITPGGVKRYKNLVLNSGIEYVRDLLLGVRSDLINVVAVGDDDTPVGAGQVTLGNELFRKQITTEYDDGFKPVWETFFTAGEAVFTWKELGLYAGADPAIADDGTLVARVTVDEAKTAIITATVLWEFVITAT